MRIAASIARRAAVVMIVIACLTPGTLTAAADESTEDGGQDAIESLTEHAVRFREASGFRSDATFVEGTFLDRQAFPNTDYGIPLTAEEGAEVTRRIAIQLKVDPVIEAVASAPGFGGAYTDLIGGGIPVFQVTDSDASFQADIARSMVGVSEFRIELVQHTRSELEALKAVIWSDRPIWAKVGIDLQSAALDIIANTVVVGVSDLTDGKATALRERYRGIEVVDELPDNQMDACNSRDDCTAPFKGGLKIVELNHPTNWCTSGFNVRLAGTSTYRVLTAGHCLGLAINGPNAAWTHHSVQFGTGKANTWAANSNADAGLISVGAPAGADNLMYGAGSGDIRTVGGYTTAASQNVNDYLCRSGAKSGFWCGNITLEDKVKDVDGKSIKHQWVVNFDAMPGDSGAPYFTTSLGVTQAWGIHSDSTSADPPGGSAWYSPMTYIFSTLDAKGFPITLCTNQYCGL